MVKFPIIQRAHLNLCHKFWCIFFSLTFWPSSKRLDLLTISLSSIELMRSLVKPTLQRAVLNGNRQHQVKNASHCREMPKNDPSTPSSRNCSAHQSDKMPLREQARTGSSVSRFRSASPKPLSGRSDSMDDDLFLSLENLKAGFVDKPYANLMESEYDIFTSFLLTF